MTVWSSLCEKQCENLVTKRLSPPFLLLPIIKLVQTLANHTNIINDIGLQHMFLSHLPFLSYPPFPSYISSTPNFPHLSPQHISSPCHRKCPSTTRSLVPLLPYRYHWVASTRRHHQSHPVPDSPSGAVARKLGTKRIGLCVFFIRKWHTQTN